MKEVGLVVLVAFGVAAGAPALAQDKVGIEVCDSFLAKYEACVKNTAGEQEQREQANQMIKQLRSAWKQMASDAQTKPSLEQACKQTVESVKPSLNAPPYNCGF